ncbi:MAG TPA: transcription elongation factor GreA [Anaerolineales bacterium]|nr:transcription elongation factor GreA [Anaerolineales bacterium]
MTNRQNFLTAEGAEKLRLELAYLKGEKREDLSKRLRIAIQQGDLSENADYIATKEEQGFVEGRILELEEILKDVVIIDGNSRKDVVDIGARVTIQEEDFDPETYYLVGPNEANPREGRISHESPIGQALMGKKVNDVVSAKVPSGTLRFKILKIE